MNNITFTSEKIWRKDFDNGSAYSISVSKQKQDGTRIRTYIPIYFAQSAGVSDKISNGTLANLSGFINPTDKGGISMTVMKVEFLDDGIPKAATTDIPDSFSAAEEDIPF